MTSDRKIAVSLAKDQLEQLDKMLATARARLDRSLRSIQEYRLSFADRVRDSAEKICRGCPSPKAPSLARKRPRPVGRPRLSACSWRPLRLSCNDNVITLG